MFDIFTVVDKDGNELKGVSRQAKHFYRSEATAKGVATQYNNITVIRNGEGVQLKGAPFRVKRWEVSEG